MFTMLEPRALLTYQSPWTFCVHVLYKTLYPLLNPYMEINPLTCASTAREGFNGFGGGCGGAP
jgi:hypothetical protein